MNKAVVRVGAWRSRWAAIGAAVAVTLGAGGIVAVNAAPSAPSSVITVEPTRILDTRTDVGLSGPFLSGVSQKLQVTGIVPTQPPGGAPAVNAEVVPATATAVVLNATVVRPSTRGFLSIRPGDATGTPATSNINWAAGGANIANSITVQLPASGQIDIFVNGIAGEVLVDVAGYMVPAAGGVPGPQGEPGVDAESPARVIWVADDGSGDFELVSAALGSITDNSSTKPYVVRVAPGVYTETAPIAAKQFVDIEGSGQGTTVLTCKCAGDDFDGLSATLDVSVAAEIRHLTVKNTGSPVGTEDFAIGVFTSASAPKSLLHVTATGAGADLNYGIADVSSPATTLSDVAAEGTGGRFARGIAARESSTTLVDVKALATGGTTNSIGVLNDEATLTIRRSVIEGATWSVRGSAGVSTRLADTELSGPAVDPGFMCVNVYTQTFTPLDAACQ